MKRLYFALGIFVIIFAVIFCGTMEIEKAHSDMKTSFSSLQKSVEKGESEKAEALAEKLESKWVDYEKKLSLFVNHAEVCEIGVAVSTIKPLIKAKQFGDVLAEIKKAQTLLCHLVNIENIKN